MIDMLACRSWNKAGADLVPPSSSGLGIGQRTPSFASHGRRHSVERVLGLLAARRYNEHRAAVDLPQRAVNALDHDGLYFGGEGEIRTHEALANLRVKSDHCHVTSTHTHASDQRLPRRAAQDSGIRCFTWLLQIDCKSPPWYATYGGGTQRRRRRPILSCDIPTT
jgi:hypothetical protein